MHIIKHFITITRHRHKVMTNCFRAGIPWRVFLHDLSKYSFTEFWQGAKYYQGFRSPNARERELFGYSKAWLHHKGRNKHHYEFWQDNSQVTGKIEPVEMPVIYLKEMLCDRIAASKIYMGDKYTDRSSLEYFNRERGRVDMHPASAEIMGEWLQYLAENGEKALFKWIRSIDNQGYDRFLK